MNGGVLNKELNEQLRNILDQLASNSDLLDDGNNIEDIRLFLAKGANPNVQNQAGKTLSYYLDEKLRDILNELESNRALLDDSNNIQYITSLLGIGADPNIQNQNGKTLSDYLNKKLSDILESNRDPLNNIQHITLLLEAGANPNVQNREDGKTLLHYVAECNDTGGIGFLLGEGANPSVRDQSGKTPLHYAAKNNCLQAIELLLKAGADPSITDKSGKTPFEYVTEPDCLQALKYWGYNLDDSHENEGNPTTPNGSVDDCSNSSGDDSQIESVKLSGCNTEEDSSCSSSDYLFLEDSLLVKLGIPLTTDEKKLIDKFCGEIRGITAQNKQESEENILESIEKIVNDYWKEGLRLNSSCSNDNDNGDKETVTNLILKEIEGVLSDRVKPCDGTKEYIGRVNDITDQDDDNEDKVSGIIENITNELLLKGGKARQKFFFGNTEPAQNYRSDYISNLGEKCEEIESKLISIACEGIVNKSKQTHEYDFKAEIDNVYFYVKYSQDSIINPAKIFNKAEALKDKALNLKVGILQIGESIVRVESIDGKRNYKDILKGSIKMSFTTEVGEISIYLHPSKGGSNKIEVEIDDESEARLNKLKAEKKSCLLGGKNVLEAIENKDFKKNGNVSTEPTETIKDVPFTDFTQACSQQIDTSVKGR